MAQEKGDFVRFVKLSSANMELLLEQKGGENYDLIYITSLFTYHTNEVINAVNYCKQKYPHAEIKVGGVMATLLPKEIEDKTGIKPHLGLLTDKDNNAEYCKPDYKLEGIDKEYPYFRCSVTFTTRGCKKSCKFCAVKDHEPNFFVKENWEEDIDETRNKIIFWDNNWLYSPNFVKDIEKLKKINKPFDFNQGLDCRLFGEEKASLLSQTKINPLRFAFDDPSEEGYIQRAIKLAQKYGFKDIRVYVLYNSPDERDTPEYFYYRINEINKLGALSYPMRYRPIYSTDGKYVSLNWDTALLRGLKLSLMLLYGRYD